MNKIADVSIGDSFKSPWGDPLGGRGQILQANGIGDFVSLILNVAFVGAGVLILFFLVIAGFNIIKSAGNGNQQDAQKAQQAATSAAVGFAIIFVAYWIVKLIELVTGSAFITNPTL